MSMSCAAFESKLSIGESCGWINVMGGSKGSGSQPQSVSGSGTWPNIGVGVGSGVGIGSGAGVGSGVGVGSGAGVGSCSGAGVGGVGGVGGLDIGSLKGMAETVALA